MLTHCPKIYPTPSQRKRRSESRTWLQIPANPKAAVSRKRGEQKASAKNVLKRGYLHGKQMLNNEFLELRDDLLAASDLTSINQRLQRSLEQYGFDSFVYGYAILPEDPFNSPAGVVFHATTDPELMAVHYEAGGISNDPVAARVFQLKEPELFDIPAVIGDRESKFYRHLMLDAAVDCGIELGALCPIKGKTGAGSLMAWTKNGSRKECRKLVEEKKDTLIPSFAGSLTPIFILSVIIRSSALRLLPQEITCPERTPSFWRFR